MKCKKCRKSFSLMPNHQGFANVCENCNGSDVERLMAEVSWEGKQTPIINITTAAKAKAFNSRNRRFGCGVLSGIVTPRESVVGQESSKNGSGAERGAQYVSRLGEKHNTKR